ncbi:prephenate dehydrogenase [Candidatus Pelagibacter sp. HIMB1321]|uniref:prephenate dehydrogenase n=1 Tax=Candidatus Pelagibacter sp. HIMB1321 TaxID=1388755 RepID=UPI000A07DE1D|nr:prephenate dehydrogenase/arogenate dehydrogenase family protein [Candidatus Pelagibacter sp. HIMB1321]SMF81620.1 prephenate dehydrogenase [Candidatus Pelagibacter sp. HIMB1321]
MKNILLIGCGLLGSSLLRKINRKKIAKKVFIFEKSKKHISQIKKLSVGGTVISNFAEGIKKSDLIILCTPMSSYKDLILKMNKHLTSKHIITDVGSSKKESFKIINKHLKKNIFWTSSHPIAGSEVSGPKHGKENLFENKWCVLIKEKDTNLKHLSELKKFWKKIGSKLVEMSIDKHDRIFSITSHLPHLIAYNLVKSAQDFEKQEKYDLIKYSAGGLRDFSRIAASNEIMWRDIFFNNKKNISKAIDLFIKNLNSFKKDINTKNNRSILNKLINTKKVRTKIIKLKQDIDKPDFGRN